MGGIGNKPSALTIDEQVELLEHGLADQNLVAQDQRILERTSSFEFDHDRPGNVHRFRPSVGVLRELLAARGEPEASHDLRGQHSPHGAGVHECVRVIGPDLVSR